jgi:hypothetical protein
MMALMSETQRDSANRLEQNLVLTTLSDWQMGCPEGLLTTKETGLAER